MKLLLLFLLVAVAGTTPLQVSRKESLMLFINLVSEQCAGDLAACMNKFGESCYSLLAVKDLAPYKDMIVDKMDECGKSLQYDNIDTSNLKFWTQTVPRKEDSQKIRPDAPEPQIDEVFGRAGVTKDQLLPMVRCILGATGMLDQIKECVNKA